ncbi:MAG: efflux RND transporter permease subunit [Verrucomicrobia bacterium]|nr:efflux RND transporter permease subunit [Verrucomicrobiota bacterium]
MRKLSEVCIKRPVFASMLILALVVVGATGYIHLQVDRYPSVDLPTIRISTRLPGASPAEVEALVSHRIEEVVNTVEGIMELRSISGVGSSFIIATFNLNRDVDSAAQDVRDRVAAVLRDLPRDADPPLISKFDTDQSPIMTIALSGQRSRRELTEMADKIVKVQLERCLGVGEVEILGGLERSINIWIDADRLAAYQIPITAVREAIVRQNANVPGGNVTGPLREHSLRTLGRITDPKAFNDLVVATINGSPIRIRDLGWSEDGTKEQRSVGRLDGVPTVMMELRRQSGANTTEVIEAVKEKIAQLAKILPADARLEVTRDQSRYIYEALHEINRHLLLGSILASSVVLLFMRSWRATFIAALAIPTSVISTFGMMWALNFTLNSVTMLALVLMVGIVIDDAIVVLENIFRFVEEKKMSAFEAARAATAEISLAVMATTFSLVVIFVPVSFMSSIAGRFLFQFGLTAAVAVLVSLLVSFTLTPMLSARLFSLSQLASSGSHSVARSRRGFYAWIDRAYSSILALAMRHRLFVAGIAVLVMLTSIPLYKVVRQEYTPGNTDEGEFEISVYTREGTSLAAMDSTLLVLESELRKIPAVRTVLASVGGSGFLGSVNHGRIYVGLAPHKERVFSWGRLLSLNPLRAFQGNYSQRDVIQEVRRRFKKFSDLRVSIRSSQSSINLGGPNYEVDFSLLGPDLEALAAYAEELRKKAPELGVVDADTTLKLDKPELRVEIDRVRAAALGVDTDDIATALRILVGGDQRVSRFRDPTINEDYDVQLRLAEGGRNDPSTISRIYVPRQNGSLVRLDNLVQIVPGQTASRIDRVDRQRQVSLRGSVAPGFAMGDRIEALRETVKEMNLPMGYTTRVSGRARELETTFKEFLWAFLLSVILMYLILASQFESVVHPFTILLSLPISVPFAMLSLWLTDNTINLYSALGILVLFGVVKKNAILQIDHMNTLRATGMERMPAIMQANRDRLRPILMTTLALVAGMLPLALGTGPGAEERRAVAVVVIGGQSLCLLLTLVVTPVAYSLLDDFAQKLHWRRWATRWSPEAEVVKTLQG